MADEASAAAVAVECGRDVEVLDERTEWQTLYAQPDGQMRLETSIAAQRTHISGEWAEIDTSLIDTNDGIAVASPAVGMVFSDGTQGQPLARMQRDGHELTFDTQFDLPEPVVVGSTVRYDDVLDGVDLIVTVNEDGTGFSEVLRVESPRAAADPRISELAFPVEVSGGLDLEAAHGGFQAVDASGETVFRSPQPAMWDSSGDLITSTLTPRISGLTTSSLGGTAASDEILANSSERLSNPVNGDKTTFMDVVVAADQVAVETDQRMLSDPSTVWPVYIDPPVTGSLAEYIAISSAGWAHYNFTYDDGVGRCNSTSMGCSTPLFTERLMWEFHGLHDKLAGVLAGDVSSATLIVFGTHSYSCTPAYVQAYRVGEFSSATRWSTSSWIVLQDAVNVAHKAACGNQRDIEFNVTEGARAVASSGGDVLAEGVKADDESTMAGWKRYRWDARLSITYNRAPGAPTEVGFPSPEVPCVSGASRPFMGTTSPTISGVFTDPDGGVRADVSVYDVPAVVGRSRLNTDEHLVAGDRLTSPDGRTVLIMQGDGNLVMYGPNGVNWHTSTWGQGGVRLVLQSDGNLVIYTAAWVPVWHIGANGLGGTHLDLQDNGNLVLYTAAGGVVWQSGTPNVPPFVPPVVWTGSSAVQASGAQHSVQISGLVDGRAYRVEVKGIDNDGRAGPVVSCELQIDTQPPATPTVTAVAGQPAVYLADTVAGGQGVAGQFTFTSVSSDVDRFAYKINDVPGEVSVAANGTSLPVPFNPDVPGSQVLTVSAIDRADNASSETLYRFSVAFPGAAGVWLLDENAGMTGADGTAAGNDLVLGNDAMWGLGLLSELAQLDEVPPEGWTDWALVFDGPEDSAGSGSAVVAANESFTVSAFVRLDDDSAPRTVVSQDGMTASGFELGYRTQGCPAGMDGCWAFAMNRADGAVPAPVVAASSVPVRTESWVHLTGVHDAGTDELTLWVCEFGPIDDLDTNPEPVSGAPVAHVPTWNSTGGLQLGRGELAGGPANEWHGVISSVRIWTGALSVNDVRTSCWAGS